MEEQNEGQQGATSAAAGDDETEAALATPVEEAHPDLSVDEGEAAADPLPVMVAESAQEEALEEETTATNVGEEAADLSASLNEEGEVEVEAAEAEGGEEGGGGEEEGEGEEGSPGITIAPRTPVLEHDPLRALTPPARRHSEVDEYQPLPRPTTTVFPLPLVAAADTSASPAVGGARAKLPEGGLAGADPSTLGSGGRKASVTVNDDMDGLKTLMKAGYWKDAARLADKLSTRSRWPHERLQCKLCLLVALVKTRQFKKATDEVDALGDLEAASTFYESYPQLYQDKRGSMVPFSLFVLRAELPSFASPEGLSRSLDALFGLLDYCRAQLSSLAAKSTSTTAPTASSPDQPSSLIAADLDSLSTLSISRSALPSSSSGLSFMEDLDQDVVQAWRGREVRVLFSISTRYVQAGDYSAALRILTSLLPLYPKDVVLLSAVGRLLLQWGNLTGAERYFRDVEQLVTEPTNSVVVMMNRGMEYIGRDRYSDAARAFERVLELEPDNVWAANNRAVCWLYLRDLQRSINSLEQLIAANPEANLLDAVVFNLCTLYDLESDSSGVKKKALLAIISQFATDDFDTTGIKA